MRTDPQLPTYGEHDRELVKRLAEIFRDYGNEINKRSQGPTYTPVLVNVANLDASTAYACLYYRIEGLVHVAGKLDVDPTAANTLTQLTLTLPILPASNFTAQEQCAGTGAIGGVAGVVGAFSASVGATTALLTFTTGADVANRSMFFEFTYQS